MCVPCAHWRSRRASCCSSLARACILHNLALISWCMTGVGWLGCGAGGRVPLPCARLEQMRKCA